MAYVVHFIGAPPVGAALRSGNADVEVHFADGRRFGATFFTMDNLRWLFEKNRRTGECAGGLYLWAISMIITEDLSGDTVARTVENLLQEGSFETAFGELPPLSGDREP